jgi:hypothetical protein
MLSTNPSQSRTNPKSGSSTTIGTNSLRKINVVTGHQSIDLPNKRCKRKSDVGKA